MFDDYDNRLRNDRRCFGRTILNGDGNKVIEVYGEEVVSGSSDSSPFSTTKVPKSMPSEDSTKSRSPKKI
jgi:hypothetical protein